MYCIIYNNTNNKVIMVINGDNLDTTGDKIMDDRGWGLKGVKSVVSYDTKATIEDEKYLDPSYFNDHDVFVGSGLSLSE